MANATGRSLFGLTSVSLSLTAAASSICLSTSSPAFLRMSSTTSCACMRKSRSPLSVWPYPLPTISSMMLRWLLNSKSSLFSPLATALLIASSSARTLSSLFESDAFSLRRTALSDFKRAFSSTRDPTCAMKSSHLPSARLLAAFAIACLTAAPVSQATIGDSVTGGGLAVLRAASFESFRQSLSSPGTYG